MLVYQEVVAYIIRKVGEDTWEEMCRWVKDKGPSLYSRIKPRGFYNAVTTIVLYHDLSEKGWIALEEITQAPIKLAHSTLSCNAKVIRETLDEWTMQHITPGTPGDWNRAARYAGFGREVQDANLEIDSFDIPIEKRGKERGRKSEYWSAKVEGPEWRFMVIADTEGKIHLISRGYSPKVYDGHWMQVKAEDLERNFQGGVFLADTHFKLKEAIRGVKMYSTQSESRATPEQQIDSDIEELIGWEKSRNASIRRGRAKLENLISSLKGPWKILCSPWKEELNQLTYLIHITAAVHNLSL